jgi:hypothetical protein
MVSILRLVLLIIIAISPVMANTQEAESPYESRYRQAHRFETNRFYDKARTSYYRITKTFTRRSSRLTTTNIVEQAPLIISAGFRLGIATSKTTYYEMHPLSHQIELFKSTDKMLQNLIIFFSEFHEEYPELLPKTQFNSLYFARAYNRIGFANKLLQGTPWKQYIVYPPADIINLIKVSKDDLRYYLFIEGVPFERQDAKRSALSFFDDTDLEMDEAFLDPMSDRFKVLEKNSSEFDTYRFSNLEDDPNLLTKIKAKRNYNQAYDVIRLLEDKQSKKLLELGRKRYTYDSILAEENNEFFMLINRVADTVGIY